MIVLVVRPIGGDHGTVNPRVGGSSPPGGAFQNWFETATNSVISKSRDENLGFFAIYPVFRWFLSI